MQIDLVPNCKAERVSMQAVADLPVPTAEDRNDELTDLRVCFVKMPVVELIRLAHLFLMLRSFMGTSI